VVIGLSLSDCELENERVFYSRPMVVAKINATAKAQRNQRKARRRKSFASKSEFLQIGSAGQNKAG
jgi:hypothetical protein